LKLLQELLGNNLQYNIAYIVHTFHVGGIERCVATLASRLDRGYCHPLIICLNRSGAGERWLECDDVPIVELHKKATNDPGVVRRLAHVLREREVDLVHSHNWGTLVETSLARRWAKVPGHVHTEHGQGLHVGLGMTKQVLHRWGTRWAFERADTVVICAESVRTQIQKRSGFQEDRLTFIPNGVERPQAKWGVRSALREQLGLPTDAFILGSVGRLVPVKGFATAIDVTAELLRQNRNVQLLLVGDGPERERLESHIDAVGIADHVQLVGRQSNVSDWLQAMDVYLNTSHSEAMSMGILEAMASGVPIVATDVGDNELLVAGQSPCGMIAPPGDVAAMADHVSTLLCNEQLCGALSANAVARHMAHYSTDRMVKSHASLYVRILSGQGSPKKGLVTRSSGRTSP
jgi:glycosyltransferase involved in cell wall biosynthesis